MPFASNAFLSGLLLLATMQMVPAPPLIALIPAAIAGADVATTASVIGAAAGVGGVIEGAVKHKRDAPVYSRVKRTAAIGNAADWTACSQALPGHYIHFTSAGGNSTSSDVVVGGLPAACVTWAGDITGKITQGNPTVIANNAIKLTGLSQSDLNEMQDAIDSVTKQTSN